MLQLGYMLENTLEMLRYFKFESIVVNEIKQNDRTRFRFVSHSAFVPRAGIEPA